MKDFRKMIRRKVRVVDIALLVNIFSFSIF